MEGFQLQKSRKEGAASTRWRRSYLVSRPTEGQLDAVGRSSGSQTRRGFRAFLEAHGSAPRMLIQVKKDVRDPLFFWPVLLAAAMVR
ncbi:hypothetical protein D7243_12250 [Stutzerimonas stutzeri]|nr:hypothetical protein [Stutzerimonas stutzeri]